MGQLKIKKKKKHKKGPDYIESWMDWQDHQFVSGYFLGGRIPHFYNDLPRPSGIQFLICGCILIAFLIYQIIINGIIFETAFECIRFIITGGIAILFIHSGIYRIRNRTP